MEHILLLPNCKKNNLPKQFKNNENFHTIELSVISNQIKSIEEELLSISTPNIIVGSDKTDAIYWIAVLKLFKSPTLILQTDDKNIDIKSGEIFVDNPVYIDVESDNIIEPQTDNKKDSTKDDDSKNVKDNSNISTKNENNTTRKFKKISELSDRELLKKISLLSSWGLNERSNIMEVESLLVEASSRKVRNPQLLSIAQTKKKQGLAAYEIFNNEILPKIRELNTHEFEIFYNEFRKNISHRKNVSILIDKKVTKEIKYIERKRILRANNTKYNSVESQLKTVVFENNHPNSLRHLQPATQWDIVIDETGSNFEESAYSLSDSSKELGKAIALIAPTQKIDKILPQIGEHHATDAIDSVNDKIVSDIINAPVGVFGFTVKDSVNTPKSSWFNSIVILIKWVLKLIPIDSNKDTKISIYIEQRSAYNSDITLMPIIDVLISELSEVDYDRYKNVKISAEFIDKNDKHPLNGYVDTISHMWGSKTKSAKTRLKKSKLLGHCLLEPNDMVMDRLYQNIDSPEKISPKEWYSLICAVPTEPKSTLIYSVLTNLGNIIKYDEKKWVAFVDEIKSVLAGNYNPLNVKRALDWLNENKSEKMELPFSVLLNKVTVDLDSANHLGIFNSTIEKRLEVLAPLRRTLYEESAKELCEIDLRVMIALTDTYQFKNIKPIIDYWKSKPTAAITKETKGKLLSTEGQYYAFIGKPDKALKCFSNAISVFKTLSDKKISRKNIRWTFSYMLIATMNNSKIDVDDFIESLTVLGGNKDLNKIMMQIINEAGEQKFLHHLLLRTFFYFPKRFKEQIKLYLSKENDWNWEATHPYQLINFYRSWLFFENSNSQKAVEYADKSFAVCDEDENGVTVKWIGYVLKICSNKLGITNQSIESNLKEAEVLAEEFPTFPIDKLNNWIDSNKNSVSKNDVIKLFNDILPFNFH